MQRLPPAFRKTKNALEPAMSATASRPSTGGLAGFLHRAYGIPAGTARSAVTLHQTCLPTDPFHPGATTGIAHNVGNHGTRITGSRYPLCAQKHVEGNQGKEELIILHQFLKIPLHLPEILQRYILIFVMYRTLLVLVQKNRQETVDVIAHRLIFVGIGTPIVI